MSKNKLFWDGVTVTFDGDQYLMTFPDQETLEQYSAQFGNEKDCIYYTSEPITDGVWFRISMSFGSRAAVACRYNDDGYLTARDTLRPDEVGAFRPMLVPLGKDGLPCCKRFQADNPDGCIVEGGIPLWNGERKFLSKKLRLMDVMDTITIGDSEEGGEKLSWLCVGGRLYCQQRLVNINSKILLHFATLFRGLAP